MAPHLAQMATANTAKPARPHLYVDRSVVQLQVSEDEDAAVSASPLPTTLHQPCTAAWLSAAVRNRMAIAAVEAPTHPSTASAAVEAVEAVQAVLHQPLTRCRPLLVSRIAAGDADVARRGEEVVDAVVRCRRNHRRCWWSFWMIMLEITMTYEPELMRTGVFVRGFMSWCL